MKLSSLPDVNFLETNPDTIQNEIITAYESLSGKKLYPADPVRLFLLTLANLIIQQRVLMNMTAKQNLLRYASGSMLDHLGTRVETIRMPAQPAKATVRFTLSAPQQTTVYIPVGTRVSPDGSLFFAATAQGQIASGSTYADIVCTCTQAGTAGNGFIPGQINLIVDPLPYLDHVTNTTTSAGGLDVEADDHYRDRIYEAPESFSVAGPEGAYIFWAKAADPGIIDVAVDSPSPGVVDIRPLMTGGAVPDQSVLDAVLAKCSDKRVRPLTDHVQTNAPGQITFSVNVSYWIAKEDEANVVAIQAGVNAAVEDYKLWQKSKLGRDINPSELIRRMTNAGAKRVTVTQPVFTTVGALNVASDTSTTVTFGGVDSA